MKENNKSKKIIVSLALILSFSAFDKAVAQEWQPNSIEKIEASIREDNKKYNEKEYDIRWGDYLYGISQATKVDMDTLAQINSITNKNLIIAGNKLYYGTNSNIVTKDSDGNTRVFQEQRYDGTKKVEEAPKNKLTGKEEKQIVEDNPSLAKDFNSKDKKDLQKQKDKLIKDGEEKNKDKIAEIDKKIKETDKKIDSKEKQKEYLQTENDKIEAEQKGDKDKADEKQKELEDKKDNDPYEIWKKEQKEKNPDLKDEDLTKEQYEIWKKNKDKKPDVKPEEPSEPEKPGKDDKEDPKKPDEKPDEKPNPDEPKKPENPKDSEDEPEEPKKPEQPTEPEKPEDKVVVKEVYEEVPFNTVRAINDPNLKTRVFQKGVNGKDLYKVTYKNGEVVKKDFVKTVSKPVDEIIQSYVKVKDAEYETRYKERFFVSGIPRDVYNNMTEEEEDNLTYEGTSEVKPEMFRKYFSTKYFDTYSEATNFSLTCGWVSQQYGSADPIEETVKVADEVWEWQ